MMKNIIAILLLGILVVAGCTQVPQDNSNFEERELPFQTLAAGDYFSVTSVLQKVFTDEEEYYEFLSSHDYNIVENVYPSIDFSKEMAIAVFQGQKTSGGYSIEITKVTEQENSILVSVKEIEAGPGQAAAVITSPYHIVKISKINKPVKFDIKIETVNYQKPPFPPVEPEKNWITELIDKELRGTDDPVTSLSKCEYKNKIVYHLVRPCCDQFTQLFDESGNSICLPGGGFTGKGDGKCPDFDKEIKNCEVIWKPMLLNENPKSIELNKEFILEVGEQAIFKEDDLRIKFLEVVEDSRCPTNVKCVRAGSIKIKIDARYDNEKNLGQYELGLGDNNEIDSFIDLIPEQYRDEFSSPVAHRIEFVKAETGSSETLDLKVFTVTFKVTEAFTQ